MSKFTTEVRFICETLAGRTESAGSDSINDIINTAAPLLFNFDFPVFDESYRLPLETKILRHYYTREICEETVGLWKLRLQDRLNMIMPYYNKLYQSELLQFNPLYDIDMTRNHTKENIGNENKTTSLNDTEQGNSTKTTTQITNNTDNRWDLYSDTPQGGIDVITNENDGVANNTYLTDARKISDSGTINTSENNQLTNTTTKTSTGTGATTLNNTEDYVEHVVGKQGGVTYSKMINEFRTTFLNIDNEVINALSDLFFGLWM